MFTEIGARRTNAKGVHLLINNKIDLEDKLTNSRRWTFGLSIVGVVFMLGSLVCFLTSKL